MIQDALDEGRMDAAETAAGEPTVSAPAQPYVPEPGSGLSVSTDGIDMLTYVSAATEIDRERWHVARLGCSSA